eukprot:1903069-Rhodomonas_salina.1
MYSESAAASSMACGFDQELQMNLAHLPAWQCRGITVTSESTSSLNQMPPALTQMSRSGPRRGPARVSETQPEAEAASAWGPSHWHRGPGPATVHDDDPCQCRAPSQPQP